MKKYIVYAIAIMAIAMSACSNEESKIDPKKDATDMAKAIVSVIDKTEVNNPESLVKLQQKVDSIEIAFYQFYGDNKKDENGASLVDSLKYYYKETGKTIVDSAMNVKVKKLQSSAK